ARSDDRLPRFEEDLRRPWLRGGPDFRSPPLGGPDELRSGRGALGNARRPRPGPPRVSARHPGRRAPGPGALGAARGARAPARGRIPMTDKRDRRPKPDDSGTLQVEESGQTPEAALEEGRQTSTPAPQH